MSDLLAIGESLVKLNQPAAARYLREGSAATPSKVMIAAARLGTNATQREWSPRQRAVSTDACDDCDCAAARLQRMRAH
jgi:hypothetical protein